MERFIPSAELSLEPEPRLEIRWADDRSTFHLLDVHAARRALFELTLAHRRSCGELRLPLARLIEVLDGLHPTAIPYP